MLLSCWKELAGYLHKGVRTVQRWEREIGLPVRRPENNRKIVLAVSEELDSWVQTRNICRDDILEQLLSLKHRVRELEAENDRLRSLNYNALSDHHFFRQKGA